MKSFILSVIVMSLSMSFAFAGSGAKGDQTKQDGIKIIREWK